MLGWFTPLPHFLFQHSKFEMMPKLAAQTGGILLSRQQAVLFGQTSYTFVTAQQLKQKAGSW